MKLLVTGATGGVGRQVVDALLRAGANDVRALTNRPARAALPAEVEVVQGYVGKPETIPPAVKDVDAMYLAPLEGGAMPPVLASAAAAGVRRVVDLSGEKDSHWGSVARDVEASGLEWTHLAPGEFMDNSLMWAEQIRTTGQVRDGYAKAANAPIDICDIADVAATTLLEDGHGGQTYSMTGPETLTRQQRVDLIGRALGTHVPYIELDYEEAIAALEPAMGREFATWYVDGMISLTAHPQPVSPVVEELLGRRGTPFADWAERNVDKFG